MSKSLYTEIVVNAPKEKVWKTLMDFENYRKWNPFIHSISGIASKGGRLNISLQQPEGRVFRFRPRVIVCEENEEFRWLGHFIIPGLFDGEHCFKLKETGDGQTKFIQSENFRGMLLNRFWNDLNTKTLKGFEMMNAALKQHIESANKF